MSDAISISHPEAGHRAAEVIQSGGLLILSTDTVYGIAADPWNPEAVARLYAAKRRAPDKAIPILLADPEQIEQVVSEVPDLARDLIETFWPGPLTVALPKVAHLPEIVSSLPTVGVRVPDHEGARAVIRVCGGALAVSSANLSGESPAPTLDGIGGAMIKAVDLILDGGPCPGGSPSTVVSFSGQGWEIVRSGPLDEAILSRVVHRY